MEIIEVIASASLLVSVGSLMVSILLLILGYRALSTWKNEHFGKEQIRYAQKIHMVMGDIEGKFNFVNTFLQMDRIKFEGKSILIHQLKNEPDQIMEETHSLERDKDNVRLFLGDVIAYELSKLSFHSLVAKAIEHKVKNINTNPDNLDIMKRSIMSVEIEEMVNSDKIMDAGVQQFIESIAKIKSISGRYLKDIEYKHTKAELQKYQEEMERIHNGLRGNN